MAAGSRHKIVAELLGGLGLGLGGGLLLRWLSVEGRRSLLSINAAVLEDLVETRVIYDTLYGSGLEGYGDEGEDEHERSEHPRCFLDEISRLADSHDLLLACEALVEAAALGALNEDYDDHEDADDDHQPYDS